MNVWYPSPPTKPAPARCNHVLHFLLTLFTFGFWAIIWLLMGVSAASENARINRRHAEQLDQYNRYMWYNFGPGRPS